jgi:hypothetical protein
MPTTARRSRTAARSSRAPRSPRRGAATKAPTTTPVLFDVTTLQGPALEVGLERVPLEQLELADNPRRQITDEGITRMARMLMTTGQVTPVIAARASDDRVLIYDGQRRWLGAHRSAELAGTPGFEDLKPVVALTAIMRKRRPSRAELLALQAQANQHEPLSLRDEQDRFADVWKELSGLTEEQRIQAVCDVLGMDPQVAHNLRRQCTLPDPIRHRVAERPKDGQLSITMANRLAEMTGVAPALAQAVAERITTPELHAAAKQDLGAFVHRTLVEDPTTYAVRLEDGAYLNAFDLISDTRPHLDDAAIGTLASVFECPAREVLAQLEIRAAQARAGAMQIRVDAAMRDRAANGGYAWVNRRGADYADTVWVVDPVFTIALVAEQLDAGAVSGDAVEETYFRAPTIRSRDLAQAAGEDRDERQAARRRQEAATHANTGLGLDIDRQMLAPTEEQVRAGCELLCRLVAQDYGRILAYGAGWSDRTRQQPTGGGDRLVPRSVESIVQAELERALGARDPVKGLLGLLARWGAAFMIDPVGVTKTKDLGLDRMSRRLREVLPGGENPMREALWALMRPMLSPHLLELNREDFVVDEQRASTVDLAARGEETPLEEIDLEPVA